MAVQTTICVLVGLVAIAGNGLLIFLFCRHKTLRKLPSFLIIDLSIVDLLNSVTNIPLLICYSVLDIPSFRGKTVAFTASFLNSLFTLLSLSIVALQKADRHLAVCWPAFYKANTESKAKLFVIVLVKWILIMILTVFVHIPLYKIDLGSETVFRYRYFYSREKASHVTRVVAFACLLAVIVFACLALRTLRERAQAMAAAGQNANSPTARLRRNAIHTIIIVTVFNIASYLPPVITIMARNVIASSSLAGQLIGFVVMISLAIPSTVDPFLFLRRVNDFKEKVKELKVAICGQPEQIALEQAPVTHCKKKKTPLTGQKKSLPAISNQRRSAKSRRQLSKLNGSRIRRFTKTDIVAQTF